MKIFPIIPIWIMLIICILLFFLIKKDKKNINFFIIIILLFLINLRIMIPSKNGEVLSNNLDVLFVIDNTISMLAEDYNGNSTRLDAVKEDCKHIIQELNGANFSIITFNNNAKIVTPFTKDNNLTIQAINTIFPIEELYAKGSSLNAPIESVTNMLEAFNDKDDNSKIIFFISDGEITSEDKLESYSKVKKLVNNGAVLGYGTETGGYMRYKDRYSGEYEYIMDKTNYPYNKAISKIHEKNLKKIANDIGINYIHMDNQKNINQKLTEIKNNSNYNLESRDISSFDDTYFILLIPLIIMLIIELNKYRRNAI